MKNKIATIMNVTNPFKSRYFTYYASVASWAKECDYVFVVDGHSDEDLLDIPNNIFGKMSNVEIIREKETIWGKNNLWHLGQSSHNLNYAIRKYGKYFDALFVVGADQVAYNGIRNIIFQNSEILNQKGSWCNFYRSKINNNKLIRKNDCRGVIIIPKILEDFIDPLHGWDLKRKLGIDFPVNVTHKSSFLDPINKSKKFIYGGISRKPTCLINIECGSYGHFWYNYEECLNKVKRWNNVFCRFEGLFPKKDFELIMDNKIYSINDYFSKDELLEWDFPFEMKKIIAEFYKPGMIGGKKNILSKKLNNILEIKRKVFVIERNIKSKLMRIIGYHGLKDYHKWVNVNEKDIEPVNVKSVYKKQDKYLPSKYKIKCDK